MTEDQLQIVFEMMGSPLRGYGVNRSAHCPLAPWTHGGGRDRRASLTAKAGDFSVFRCWSCREQGTVRKLARLYAQYSGDSRAFEYVREIEGDSLSLFHRIENSYGDLTYVGKKINRKIREPGPTEDSLKKFLEKIPLKYLLSRGIGRNEVKKYEIGYDSARGRMIVPIRDQFGKLVGISGRDVTGKKLPKWFHYPGFRKELVLYGEHLINPKIRRGYMVEGFVDVWHLDKCGCPNVLASMGTSLSMEQIKKLMSWFTEIVFMPDFDDDGAGLRFCEQSCELLLLQAGLHVGIAGAEPNPEFVQKRREQKWSVSDYRLRPIANLIGKDPADMSMSDLRLAVQNIRWFSLGKDGVTV